MIHAVGYDFRRPGPWGSAHVDEDAVVDLLGGLYAKILALASKYGRKKLRLVPISAGIFSASYSRMPELTAQALLGAINMTFGADAAEDPHRSTYVDMIEYIEMCIYMESDYRAYAGLGAHEGRLPPAPRERRHAPGRRRARGRPRPPDPVHAGARRAGDGGARPGGTRRNRDGTA